MQGLYLNHLYLLTADTFPCAKTRSEVIKRQEVEYSPIENAIKSVSDKNTELLSLISKLEEKPDLPLNPLTMCLNGFYLF